MSVKMMILMIVRRLLTKVVDGAEVLALAYGHGSGVIGPHWLE